MADSHPALLIGCDTRGQVHARALAAHGVVEAALRSAEEDRAVAFGEIE